MSKLAWRLIAVGSVAASVAVAPPARAFNYECNGDQAKCPSVRCSGDETACQVLGARQDGVDHETGAHIVIGFHVSSDQVPQTMELVLTIGEKLSDCNGSSREVYANASNADPRSIDGLLCNVRATWTRH
jgi:hypothetical protein